MRRGIRALLMMLTTTAKVLATGFYTLNTALVTPLNKTYRAKVNINGTTYDYDSDYPFYLVQLTSTTYYIACAYGYVYRSGNSYNPPKIDLGYIDGIKYVREIYTRSIPSNMFNSVVDVELWQLQPTTISTGKTVTDATVNTDYTAVNYLAGLIAGRKYRITFTYTLNFTTLPSAFIMKIVDVGAFVLTGDVIILSTTEINGSGSVDFVATADSNGYILIRVPAISGAVGGFVTTTMIIQEDA